MRTILLGLAMAVGAFALNDMTFNNTYLDSAILEASQLNEDNDSTSLAYNRLVDSLELKFIRFTDLNSGDSTLDTLYLEALRGNPDVDSLAGSIVIDTLLGSHADTMFGVPNLILSADTVKITKDLDVAEDITVAEDIGVSGKLVTDSLTAWTSFVFTGDISASGKLVVDDSLRGEGRIQQSSGDSLIAGHSRVIGNLAVGGSFSISGNLDVPGKLVVDDSLRVAGMLEVTDTLKTNRIAGRPGASYVVCDDLFSGLQITTNVIQYNQRGDGAGASEISGDTLYPTSSLTLIDCESPATLDTITIVSANGLSLTSTKSSVFVTFTARDGDSVLFVDDGNFLMLAGNFLLDHRSDVLTLLHIGDNKWAEVSRSNNQ